jgi:hypothetical protein
VSINDYLQSVKERLLTDPEIVSFTLICERATLIDGYLRARLVFPDESYLEFSEYVQVVDDKIKVVTYSYHWATHEDNLLKRWDNTPHFVGLPGFPHHVHEGENVFSGRPVDIFIVLDEITQALASH